MAKKSAVERNDKRKRLVERYAAKREELKAIALNEDLPLEERFQARLKLAELPRNSAPNRDRKRSEESGRHRGSNSILKKYRLAQRENVKCPVVRAVTTANSRCLGSPCVSLAHSVRSQVSSSLAGKEGI